MTRNILLIVPVVGNVIIWLYDQQKKADALMSLSVIEDDGLNLEYCSKEEQNCEEAVKKAVRKNKEALRYASERLKNKPTFIKELLDEHKEYFLYAGDSIRKNEDFILSCITEIDCSILKYVPDALFENQSFIEKGMKINPSVLTYALNYRDDETFMLAKCRDNLALFKFASKRLKRDPQFIAELINFYPQFLGSIKGKLKENEKFMESLIKLNKETLTNSKFASNKNFVRKLVKEDLSIFEFASDELRSDKSFIQEFREEGMKILLFACDSIRKDIEFNKYLIINFGLSLKWVHEDLKRLREVVFEAAILEDCKELVYAAEELTKNKQFAESCFQCNASSLQYFSEEVKSDPEFILKLVELNPEAISFAANELQNDRKFLLDAIKINASVFNYLGQFFKQDVSFQEEALSVNWGTCTSVEVEKIACNFVYGLYTGVKEILAPK